MKYFCGCSASPDDVPKYCPEHYAPAIDFDGVWEKVLHDESLKSIRKRVSIHDLRTLFNVAVEGLTGLCEEDARMKK